MLQMLLSYSRPVVGKPYFHFISILPDSDLDPRSLRRPIFHRVVKQIHEHSLHLPDVEFHLRFRRLRPIADIHLPVCEPDLFFREQLPDIFIQVYLIEAQKFASFVHLDKKREASGQSLHIVHPCQNSVTISVSLFRSVRDPVLDAHRVSLYGCQRRTQIMGDPAESFSLLLLVPVMPLLRLFELHTHAVKFFAYLSEFVVSGIRNAVVQIPLCYHGSAFFKFPQRIHHLSCDKARKKRRYDRNAGHRDHQKHKAESLRYHIQRSQ